MGLRRVIRLPRPVISIGNITVGGTGKTAVVDHLLYDFESKGLKVCVLTRGYGRTSKEDILISSEHTASQVGDEPLWLFQRHPNTKILVSSNRAEAALKIKDVDLFLMDDGFQHYELKKDFEVVLLDATRPDWHYELLPQGFARVPWKHLQRADLVVITRSNQVDDARVDEIVDRVYKTGVMDVSLSFIDFSQCMDLLGQSEFSITGKKCFLVSGIANPGSFEALTKQSGANVVRHVKEMDHAQYNSSKIAQYFEQAKKLQADLILITEKDAVKWREILKDTLSFPIPVGVSLTQLTFDPGLEGLVDAATHNFS